jgi:hypothetical protein
MAWMSHGVLDLSFVAENNLTTKQHFLVELSAENQVDVCDGAADRVLGVLMNEPDAGQGASVRILGVAMVISDGSGTEIVAGDYVGSNGTGYAVKKATADYSVCGLAMAGSAASGTLIPVLLFPGGWFRTAGG